MADGGNAFDWGWWKGNGALVVATIALVQPWVLRLWRAIFRRGTLDIFKTGTIEVGYSGFGPTVALHGTFAAVHKDLFVSGAHLTVVRLADQATHRFEWAAFRSPAVNLSRPTDVNVALPAGSMVGVARPQRFNIVFNDVGLQQQMIPIIETVRTAWGAAVHAAIPGGALAAAPAAAQAQLNQAAQATYPVFQHG